MKIKDGFLSLTACVLLQIAMTGLPLIAQDAASSAPPQRSSEDFTIVSVLPSAGTLAAVLGKEASKAQQAGRKPYAYFSAEWCGPCKALHKSLEDHDPLMEDAFAGAYIIQLDVDAWKKEQAPGTTVQGIGFEEDGFKVEAIPVFFELDHDGKPTGRRIDGSAWGEDIPRNMAPPLKAFFHPN